MGSWILDQLAKLSGEGGRNRQRRRYARLAVEKGYEKAYLDRIVRAIVDNEKDLAEGLIKYLVREVWRTLDPSVPMKRFRKYFLEHLYYLLNECNDREDVHFVLSKLEEQIDGLRDKKYIKLAQEYCKQLNSLVQANNSQDDSQDDIEKAVSELRKVLNDFGTPIFGIEGGRYAYDFYRRADSFFKRSRESSPTHSLTSRDYPGHYNPKVFEDSHNLLDKLKVDEQNLPSIYLHRYWEKLMQSQTLQNLPAPEKVVVETIMNVFGEWDGGIDPTESAFEFLIGSLAIESPCKSDSRNYKDLQGLRVKFTNISGKQSTEKTMKVTPDSVSMEPSSLSEIPAWDSEEILLRFETGLDSIEVALRLKIDGAELHTETKLAWETFLKDYALNVPSADLRIEEGKIGSMSRRSKLLDKMEQPLAMENSGTVQLVCGIPHIGKTTLLKQFRERIRSQGYLVVDVDFCRLDLSDLEGEQRVPSKIRRTFLKNIVDNLDCSESKQSDFIDKLSVTDDDKILTIFREFLAGLLKDHRLVVLLDGVEVSVLKKSPFIRKFLNFEPSLNFQNDKSEAHWIICGTEALIFRNLSHYDLISSISPANRTIVGPLKEKEEIKQVLEQPFPAQDTANYDPNLWYDDLAVQAIEQYTGGHPLLVNSVSRAIIDLLKEKKLPAPINGPEIYNLLYAPIETCGDHNFQFKVSQLRNQLSEHSQRIWKELSPDTREELEKVLHWKQTDNVQNLQDLGLLRITPDGTPKVQIRTLEPYIE